MAGAPFDILRQLATTKTRAEGRELVRARSALTRAKTNAEDLLNRRDNGLSSEEFRELRSAVRQGRVPTLTIDLPEFFDYCNAAQEIGGIQIRFEQSFAADVNDTRVLLLKAADQTLPRYLVFGGRGTADLLAEAVGQKTGSLAPRNKRARERERHLLLYLQRVTAKNDTFSEFGPTSWGRINTDMAALTLEPQPGIAAREVFLERWTAHAIAAAMNADAETFDELCPRVHPNGRILNDEFVSAESGEKTKLEVTQIALIARCDGRTPVYRVGADAAAVRALVESKILRCEIEVPAMDPHAFAAIHNDVSQWRDGAALTKWLSILEPIAELSQKFRDAVEVQDRERILQGVRERLQELGATREVGERFLYAATNPIGEECFRECGFSVSEKLMDEAVVDAAPWIDLWRDSYAFVASRVAAGLRRVLATMPIENGAVPLPAFLRACDTAKLPLTGPGLVALSHMAFQEVKTAFREMMKTRSDQAEYELTTEDCHFVRQRFEYPKFDEYTYPSADWQISARSPEAVAAGDYQWILAELHPPVALLHHGGYWSCPDKKSLNRAFAQTTGGKPNFHFGFFAADFTSHTTVRLFDALPELSYFVAPQRGNPKWRTVAPAEAEVHVDDTSGDVCLRKIGSHEYLGSFARAWLIPLGFHPFQFGMEPHTPRLRCGRVIVQRRSWTVAHEELGPGNYTGVSRDLVLAMEQLRARKDLPRYVYIRPTEQALRRSGAEGRDKDTKPVFVDLESYLFLEIFHRWLVKAGQLEVTEMLPDPDHLLWPESDGRRTFELRTMIVPGS